MRSAKRTTLQRVTARDAPRAAKDVAGAAGEHAARAAGDPTAVAARIQYAGADAETGDCSAKGYMCVDHPNWCRQLTTRAKPASRASGTRPKFGRDA